MDKIDANTRLKDIAAVYPWLMEELPKKDSRLAILNTAFGRAMVKRMTVGDVAGKTGKSVEELAGMLENLVEEYRGRTAE